jgi:opacity protein-like surface antigen
MILKRGHKLLMSSAIAAGLSALSLTAANAQNSEGTYQVRVGAFLDLGGTKLSNTNTLDAGGSTDTGKFGVGMSGGLEMLRAGKWTLGIEGDLGISGGGGQNLNGVRYGTDFFSSLRGRAGFYIRPDWVLYGTGGVAFRGVTVDAGPSFGAKVQKTLSGGVIGAGTEWHYGGTILFAEYLHTSLSGADFATNGTTYLVKGNSDQFRLGVKFKLGYDGYYDYVRDEIRK